MYIYEWIAQFVIAENFCGSKEIHRQLESSEFAICYFFMIIFGKYLTFYYFLRPCYLDLDKVSKRKAKSETNWKKNFQRSGKNAGKISKTDSYFIKWFICLTFLIFLINNKEYFRGFPWLQNEASFDVSFRVIWGSSNRFNASERIDKNDWL